MNTPPPASPPSAGITIAILLTPAALCLALALGLGQSGQIGAAIGIVAIAVIGSLVCGIWSGIRLARQFVGGSPSMPWVATGLSFVCMATSAALCFGGCVAVLS